MQDITNELVIFKTSEKGEDIKNSLIRLSRMIDDMINRNIVTSLSANQGRLVLTNVNKDVAIDEISAMPYEYQSTHNISIRFVKQSQ